MGSLEIGSLLPAALAGNGGVRAGSEWRASCSDDDAL